MASRYLSLAYALTALCAAAIPTAEGSSPPDPSPDVIGIAAVGRACGVGLEAHGLRLAWDDGQAVLRGTPPPAGCDDGSVIDLMVVYTAQARAAAGGTAALVNRISIALDDANDALARSQINTTVRLVHTQEVVYAETGQAAIDAPRLFNPADGFLDEVHPLRDQYGADCVSLWVNSFDYGGVGFYPHPSLTGIGASGFTIMRQDNYVFHTLAHELGHNFFCGHDRANTVDAPYAEYSYGYREPGSAWHDIMAYPPGDTIPYFANPNVNWPGPVPPNPGPTGVPEGQPFPCDIARTMNELRFYVANFRPTAVSGLPSVLYVRESAPAGGDGLSWATAFRDLQDALCAAAGSHGSVDELWVAAGAYKPDRGGGDRAANFRLLDGLTIYGGFNGTETLLNQRNPAVNVTVLSGDIGVAGNNADNSFHVLTGTGTTPSAVLDGCTITQGNANGGNDADDGGGGLMCYAGGSPTLQLCTFTQNRAAKYGGAVRNYLNAAPRFSGCTFSGNVSAGTAWPEGGGAVHNYDSCGPIFSGCTFSNNQANIGGAIANLFGCSPTLTSCGFDHNVAAGPNAEGGAIYNYSVCNPIPTACTFTLNNAVRGGAMAVYFDCLPALAQCVFDRNTADEGGAMYNYGNGSPTVAECVFAENSATYGGGMSNLFDSVPIVTRCVFRKNNATADGGAVSNYTNASAEFTNCLFTGNTAGSGAGALVSQWSSNAKLTNCTLSGNSAGGVAGGVYTYQSAIVIANSLLWGNRVGGSMNEGDQLFALGRAPSITNSSIQGWTGGFDGTSNNGSNPQFIDADGADNLFGTSDDNARIPGGSPAANTGNNAAIPPGTIADLDGRPRIVASVVDRGAYEFGPPFGDRDADGDIDLADYATFPECMNGPNVSPNPLPPPTPVECVTSFDGNLDNDVDLGDYAAIQRTFTG